MVMGRCSGRGDSINKGSKAVGSLELAWGRLIHGTSVLPKCQLKWKGTNVSKLGSVVCCYQALSCDISEGRESPFLGENQAVVSHCF